MFYFEFFILIKISYQIIVNSFKNIQKNKVPSKVLSEEDKASAILRDNFNADFVSIICDDEQMVNDMKNYIEVIAPERKNIVQFYDRPTPLLEYYNVEKQLKQSFGKHVNIPSSKGAYLAVSYTHLDVYKRQVYEKPFFVQR